MNYQNIKSDLLQLYCFTKNKRIEDVFQKFAESIDAAFLNWLKTANLTHIGVSNQTVSGINFLLRMREKFPSGISFSTVATHFADNPSDANGFAQAKILSDLSNDPRASNLLNHFSDILTAIKPISLVDKDKNQVANDSSKEIVANDLVKIYAEFEKSNENQEGDLYSDIGEKIHPPKESKKEKSERLFTFLLHEFTKEIQNALVELGDDLKANVIKNWAIANPVEIINYFKPQGNINAMGDDAVYVVKTIMKTIKENTPEEQFNFIRNRAMFHGKILTKQEYKNYYLNKIKSIDLSKFTGSPTQNQTNDRLKLTSYQITNPDAIVFISLVLYGIYEKVK